MAGSCYAALVWLNGAHVACLFPLFFDMGLRCFRFQSHALRITVRRAAKNIKNKLSVIFMHFHECHGQEVVSKERIFTRSRRFLLNLCEDSEHFGSASELHSMEMLYLHAVHGSTHHDVDHFRRTSIILVPAYPPSRVLTKETANPGQMLGKIGTHFTSPGL